MNPGVNRHAATDLARVVHSRERQILVLAQSVRPPGKKG
jgi:hypothetical protein